MNPRTCLAIFSIKKLFLKTVFKLKEQKKKISVFIKIRVLGKLLLKITNKKLVCICCF